MAVRVHVIHPDAVIVQDLAMAQLIRQSGFAGEVHRFTLSNVSFPVALLLVIDKLPIEQLVIID